MSVPPVPQVFESGLRKYPLRSGYLDTLIRQQLDVISKDLDMNTPPPSCSDPEDLVAEIGDYFARTANVWAKLSERLSHGPHIDQASLEAHERSQAVSRMSDLTELTRLDVHVSKLRFVARNVHQRLTHGY